MSFDTRSPTGDDSKGAKRLEDRVFADLVGKIRGGALGLGQRLPSEVDLASEYQVSRPVVRSALAMLRDEGLIVSRRGSGSYVAIGLPEEGGGYSPLNGIDDIAAVFDFRRLIEREAAARASLRATPEDIAELDRLIAEMEAATEVEAETTISELDRGFHVAVAKLSDSKFILESLEMLRPHQRFIAKFVRTLGPKRYETGKLKMNDEHREILAAIKSGKPEAAGEAMVRHIEMSQRRVFKGE